MYREPSEDHIKGRMAWHAGGQVITGWLFIVGGVTGFLLTRNWAAVIFIGLGAFCVLYWGPVWRKFGTKSRDAREEDLFPGGRL